MNIAPIKTTRARKLVTHVQYYAAPSLPFTTQGIRQVNLVGHLSKSETERQMLFVHRIPKRCIVSSNHAVI